MRRHSGVYRAGNKLIAGENNEKSCYGIGCQRQENSFGSVEYVFLVDVSPEQNEKIGYAPEVKEGDAQAIKDVCWKGIEELSEKDRAFLWSYGLLEVEDYFEHVICWGDQISYPEVK